MWKCYEPDVRIGLSMLRIGLCEHLGRRKVWGQTRREKKRCDDDCPELKKKRRRKILYRLRGKGTKKRGKKRGKGGEKRRRKRRRGD